MKQEHIFDLVNEHISIWFHLAGEINGRPLGSVQLLFSFNLHRTKSCTMVTLKTPGYCSDKNIPDKWIIAVNRDV